MKLQSWVSLADYCSLGVGGVAEALVECHSDDDVLAAAALAYSRKIPVTVLGRGTNVIPVDGYLRHMFLVMKSEGITIDGGGARARVTALAGTAWDSVVMYAVQSGLAGVEALSGIPGSIGAAPVQNIGAYGQELVQVLESVAAIDVTTGDHVNFSADSLDLAYRDSKFKHPSHGRFVITAVTLAMSATDSVVVSHPEVADRLGSSYASPTEVRRVVLDVREEKGMVLSKIGARRTVGSFFCNPVVDRARAHEILDGDVGLPADADVSGLKQVNEQEVRLPAAWLIEAVGYHRGHSFADGRVRLSTDHVLAIEALAGATADDILAVADEIVATVMERFGVRLAREPVAVGDSDIGEHK